MYLDIRDNNPDDMWAEGSTDTEPTKEMIETALKTRGWEAQYVKIYFDDFQEVWRFVCGNITKVKTDRDLDLEERFNITRENLCKLQHKLFDYSIFFGIGDNLTVYYEERKHFKAYIKSQITDMLVQEGVKRDQVVHEYCGRMELY